jgi:DUF4097 and DUF4098 domain-containing protein YvlB
MKKRSYILIFLLLLVSLDISYASKVRKTFRKTVSFKSSGEIILENMNGSIEIDTWNKNEVSIYAEIRVTAPSRRTAEEYLDKVEILIEERGKILEIYSEYPRRRRSRDFLSSLFGRNISVSISYRLSVPKLSDLDIQTTNGKINIYEVEGYVEAKTSNGSINVEKITGSANVYTTNGQIQAEILNSNSRSDMSFKTTNGSIKVYFPRDIEADIYANTTNGRVNCDFPISSRYRTRNNSYRRYTRQRSLRGAINGGGIDIEMRTTNGSIYILEY